MKVELLHTMKFFTVCLLFFTPYLIAAPLYTNNTLAKGQGAYGDFTGIDNNQTRDTMRQISLSRFNLRAFHTNFLLPASYAKGRTYPGSGDHKIKQLEVEFQISLRYDFAQNPFGLHGLYSAAYTQHSFWQAYAKSAYFRETNYNPELFATFPIYKNSMLHAARIEVAHQSNGRGGANERSWNYVAGSLFLQYHSLFIQPKLWTRFNMGTDYNPDLLKYLGHGSVTFLLPYEKNLFKLTLRSNLQDHGAAIFAYSYPIAHTNGLFFYVRAFSGYGESLIDYNHYVNKIGVGFSISR
jgi:phospholipase A1/A2